jgi:predicted phosphodiesterase
MRFGILSDVHEDIDSLLIAMDIFTDRKCDELVCLGDIIGFDPIFYKKIKNRNASECIKIIRDNFKHVVIGNHDLFAIKKIPVLQNGNFLYPPNWYDLSIEERKQLSNDKLWYYLNERLLEPLTDVEIEYLANLPEYLITKVNYFNILFSHSVYPDHTGSNFFRLHNPWELQKHFSFMQSKEILYGFSGHMHSNKLLYTTQREIKHISYKKHQIHEVLSQYLCPCIANGKGKSGLIIADFNTNEIESIEINKFKFNMFSFYGRRFKKN